MQKEQKLPICHPERQIKTSELSAHADHRLDLKRKQTT
jgi:hypothetical protein